MEESQSHPPASFPYLSCQELKDKDYETDLWMFNEAEPNSHKSSFEVIEELDAVREARKGQTREIYQFLEDKHGGKFQQFASKMARSSKKFCPKKKIRKTVSLFWFFMLLSYLILIWFLQKMKNNKEDEDLMFDSLPEPPKIEDNLDEPVSETIVTTLKIRWETSEISV